MAERDVQGKGSRQPSNLVLRVASAAVLAPLAFGVAWFGGWPFALFWTLAGVAVVWEWVAMIAGQGNRLLFSAGAGAVVAAAFIAQSARPVAAIVVIALGALAVFVLAPMRRGLWMATGVGYAGALALAPLYLRQDAQWGFIAIALVFVVVWMTDILGYFGGRAFGGPKLAAAISPKKTWSGALAGAFGAIALTAVGAHYILGQASLAILVLALGLSIASQAGDLLESAIKRKFGVKDAGSLIPGHGGVMDRLDGFWTAVLMAAAIGITRGGFEAPGRGLLLW